MSASGASQQQVAPRPLCPDSDQILHLAEMTRWARSRLMHRSKSVLFDQLVGELLELPRHF